jgi:predicted enzyme related to lactoylglutathione lyase
MSGKVVHFEVPADDLDRAQTFYGEVFGWRMAAVPGLDYTMVTTGPTDGERGPAETGFINGGMYERGTELAGRAPNLVIDVPSIDDALRRVEAAGGTTVSGPTPVGQMGFTGYFTDTEGNLVGLWQDADGS